MVIEKKYRKSVLLIVTLLTIFIFSLGVFLGWSFDKLKTDKVLDIFQQNEIAYESLLAEEQFFETFGGKDCKLLAARTADLSRKIAQLGEILEIADTTATFNEAQIDLFKRRYFILEILFLTRNYELSKTCDTQYNVILFFYKKDHQPSSNQGYILDALNQEYDYQLTILSFDFEYYDEPLIEMLKERYDIEEAPSVIVNNIVRKGPTSKEEIHSILKGTYKPVNI